MNGMVDAKLLESLQQSTCFGIAYDLNTPECKQCDVQLQCRRKTEGVDIPTPSGKEVLKSLSRTGEEPKKAAESSKPKVKSPEPTKAAEDKKPKAEKATSPEPKVKKPPKPKAEANPNMPNFKEMSWDALVEQATKFGITPKDYKSEAINRMRLIMELKKHY